MPTVEPGTPWTGGAAHASPGQVDPVAAAACLPMVATQEEGCGCQRLRSLWGGRGEEEINRDFSCMYWSKEREKIECYIKIR